MFVIGMAYRGTANNAAIQKLLHFAVSDVSDDVRRAAVLCLGFVLMGVPEQCPRIVSLLSQSYNPYVRYGAAMAVGISCSGTGIVLQCHLHSQSHGFAQHTLRSVSTKRGPLARVQDIAHVWPFNILSCRGTCAQRQSCLASTS